MLTENKRRLESENANLENLQTEEGHMMINKDGTLNFQIFSKKSQMKQSTYQKDPKLEGLLTNQNIVESETKKEGALHFYYGKKVEKVEKVQKSEKSLRGTITKDVRMTHANSGNIVGKFMREGNAQKLLEGRREREMMSRGPVDSLRKEDSNGFGFARRKEDTSLVKNSLNPKSKNNGRPFKSAENACSREESVDNEKQQGNGLDEVVDEEAQHQEHISPSFEY